MDELDQALALAELAELRLITDILFRRQFNPWDYVATPRSLEIQSQTRAAWLAAIAARFRFLAADGMTVLRQRTDQVSYRESLQRVCHHLHLPYSDRWSTLDLEAEIFLQLLEKRCDRLSAAEHHALNRQLARSLQQSPLAQQLPTALQRDPLRLLVTGSSALTVTSVLRPWLLQQFAQQFARHAVTYQASQHLLRTGGMAIAQQMQQRLVGQVAARGMAVNAARYTATRSVCAVLGPALWAWFLADLGWRTIATNYGRIIPVIFTLAQIRLTRLGTADPPNLGRSPTASPPASRQAHG